MSKQSKTLSTQNYFGISFTSRPKSQSYLPNSADKGNTSYRLMNQNDKKSNKAKKDQFYLEYKVKKNDFLGFYRMKSLICPISSLKAEDLRNFTILGTFDSKIIIAFHRQFNIFCFFDQHAMHERIRYEYYIDELNFYSTERRSPKNWDCQIIEKNKKEVKAVSRIKNSYITLKVTNSVDDMIQSDFYGQRYGFEVQYIKNQRVLKVLRVPDILERTLDQQLVLNIANDIILQKPHLPKCLESIIAEISCKSAYKFNDYLDRQTVEKLIQNLSLCQYPFFCVHGRPTLFTKL